MLFAKVAQFTSQFTVPFDQNNIYWKQEKGTQQTKGKQQNHNSGTTLERE